MADFAYLVMVHDQPEALSPLIEALEADGDLIVIHVDATAAPAVHEAATELASSSRAVHVLPAEPVRWGGWSQVRVQLRGLAAALDLDRTWRWCINLSGRDFPLTTRAERLAHFEASPDVEWIVARPIDTHPPAVRRRVQRVYLHIGHRPWPTPLPLPARVGPRHWYKGSSWWMLTRTCCAWLLVDRGARRLRRVCRVTANPDEQYFQTAIMQGPFAARIADRRARLDVWEPGAPHPRVLTEDDWALLRQSECLFARKFDRTIDAAILDRLRQHLGS